MTNEAKKAAEEVNRLFSYALSSEAKEKIGVVIDYTITEAAKPLVEALEELRRDCGELMGDETISKAEKRTYYALRVKAGAALDQWKEQHP